MKRTSDIESDTQSKRQKTEFNTLFDNADIAHIKPDYDRLSSQYNIFSDCVQTFFQNNNVKFENKYLIGSYARHTAIKGKRQDIDILFVLTDEKPSLQQKIILDLHSLLVKNLKNFLIRENLNNNLFGLINEVKQGESCVTVTFQKIEFDLVTVFRESGGGFSLYSKRLKKKRITDPLAQQKRGSEVLKNFLYVKEVIRFMKFWNKTKPKDSNLQSIYIEFLVYEALDHPDQSLVRTSKYELLIFSLKQLRAVIKKNPPGTVLDPGTGLRLECWKFDISFIQQLDVLFNETNNNQIISFERLCKILNITQLLS